MNMGRFITLISLLALSSVSNAAPMPATSISLLTNEKPGMFRSSKGFSVNAGKTEWVLGEPPTDLPSVVTVFKSPENHKGVQPVLTVRVDELTKRMDLKAYAREWLHDYNQLGFNILKTKNLKVNSYPAFAMDVEEAHGQKKLRQIVFLRNQTAVVLTCRDLKETFSKTVKACNEIFKSFAWSSSASQPESKPTPSSQTGV
jgi:hypothetical protein